MDSLLEWSNQLDRRLLNQPFAPFHSTLDQRARFLYKLIIDTDQQQLGLLLLDPDTCLPYFEGLSLRSLQRRSQLHLEQEDHGSIEQPPPTLLQIQSAIDAALANPPSTSHRKRVIGVDQNRFSCSLSIDVRDVEKPNDGYRFKVSFDMDPLDHSASAVFLSAHFIRPLVGLASVVAKLVGGGGDDDDGLPQASLIKQMATTQQTDAKLEQHAFEMVRKYSLYSHGLPVEEDASKSLFHQDSSAHPTNPSQHSTVSFGPASMQPVLSQKRKHTDQDEQALNQIDEQPMIQIDSTELDTSSSDVDPDATVLESLLLGQPSIHIDPTELLASSSDIDPDATVLERLFGRRESRAMPSSSPCAVDPPSSPPPPLSLPLPPSSFQPTSSQVSPQQSKGQKQIEQQRRQQLERLKTKTKTATTSKRAKMARF